MAKLIIHIQKQAIIEKVIAAYREAIKNRIGGHVPTDGDIWIIENAVDLTIKEIAILMKMSTSIKVIDETR